MSWISKIKKEVAQPIQRRVPSYQSVTIQAVKWEDQTLLCQLLDSDGDPIGSPNWFPIGNEVNGLMSSSGMPKYGDQAILFPFGDGGIVFITQNRGEVIPETFDLGHPETGLPGEGLDFFFTAV